GPPAASTRRGRKSPRTTRGTSRARTLVAGPPGLEDGVGGFEDARGAPFVDGPVAEPRLEVAPRLLKPADAQHAPADVGRTLGLNLPLGSRQFARVGSLARLSVTEHDV